MAIVYSQHGTIVRSSGGGTVSRCSSSTFKIVDKNGYVGDSIDNLTCNYCVIINWVVLWNLKEVKRKRIY